MGPIDLPSGKEIAAAFAVVAVVAGGIVGGIGWSIGRHSMKNNGFLIEMSPARQQLLEQGFAGNKGELQQLLNKQVDEYFKSHNLPCDPGETAKTVGATLEKARNCEKPAP